MATPGSSEETPPSACFPCDSIQWSGLTDRGRFRSNNEDSFLALTFDGHEVRYLGKTGEASLTNADFVFAVSDGMGGEKSGEFASRIAIERITWLLPRSFRQSASGLSTGFSDILNELFSAIHLNLLKLGQSYSECSGMGATLSLTWFTPGWMYFAHVGDSRIYYLSPQEGLKQLTHDHTYVGGLRRSGKINEREARSHPRRNALHQALGAGNQFLDPQIGAVGYNPGDRFLICSDGLVDGLWDRNLDEMLRGPTSSYPDQTLAHYLVSESVRISGRDNTTAVVVDVPSPTPKSP